MDSDYGARAAAALGEIIPPKRHRPKVVQKLFRCSRSMAYYLLAGDHWTAKRLSQASELLGDAFDAAFSKPENSFQRQLEGQRMDAEAMRLETHIGKMHRRLYDVVAPQQSVAPYYDKHGAKERKTRNKKTCTTNAGS